MIATKFKNPADLVDQYVDQVTSGARVAGRCEKLAVRRYLDDLDNAAKRGWYLDRKIAREAVLFFPLCLRHSIGEWSGDPFELDPWQAFITWNLQGWRSLETGLRRFRKAYVTVARKNGKTTWAAGFACQLLYLDNPIEPGARGFCAATKKPQAALLWDEARRMIESSPTLGSRTRIRPSRYEIMIPGSPWNESTLQPVGADATRQDGLNPSFVFKDEIHAWTRSLRDLNEKLSTGGASRRQPLEVIITTAGDDNSEIWEEEHDFATKVVESIELGQVVDDTFFSFICQADDEDDPFDEATWQKANPNYGISVKPSYIAGQAAEAAAMPAKWNQFVRYHCNRRTASFEQAYPIELWKLGAQDFPDPVDGSMVYAGLDLGRTDDWAAVTLVFPEEYRDDEKKRRWRFKIVSHSWACEGINSKIPFDRDPFRTWIAEGLMSFQKGNEVLDFAEIKQFFRDVRRRYQLKQVVYDKTFAHELAASLLNDYGIPVFDFFQNHHKYTEPILSFDRALKRGDILHRSDPVLAWQAGNAQVVTRPDGLMMIDKGNGQRWKKIDAIVALLMGYSGAIYAAKKSRGSAFLMPGGRKNEQNETTAAK